MSVLFSTVGASEEQPKKHEPMRKRTVAKDALKKCRFIVKFLLAENDSNIFAMSHQPVVVGVCHSRVCHPRSEALGNHNFLYLHLGGNP